MSKTAIIILSDPKAGAEESIGRVLNALAAAYDFKQADEEVKILFQGTGTRWPEELAKESHKAHKLYLGIKENILGVSAACSEVWGANPSGLDLIADNPLPETAGLPSLAKLRKEGYTILIF